MIPARIIRGKMKILLEMYYGLKDKKEHLCNNKKCFLCKLFGAKISEEGPSRLLVRDGLLQQDKNFTWELKFEGNNVVKRVPPQTVFIVEFIYRIFEDNNDKGREDYENFKYIPKAFELIENDYLGKGGARGSGKVEFLNINLVENKKILSSNTGLSVPSGWELKEIEGIKKLVRI